MNDLKKEIKIIDSSVWMTSESIAIMFGINTVELKIIMSDILTSGSLDNGKSIKKIEDKISKSIYTFFNIDLIISIGYRLKDYSKIKKIVNINRSLKNVVKKDSAINNKVIEEKNSLISSRENTLNKSISLVKNTLSYIRILERFT